VSATRVVTTLNPRRDRHLRVGPPFAAPAAQHFALERRPKILRHRAVIDDAKAKLEAWQSHRFGIRNPFALEWICATMVLLIVLSRHNLMKQNIYFSRRFLRWVKIKIL
jgi:hypothetical protein